MSDPRRYAPATLRNRDPLLAVLRHVLPPRGLVLEVAAGTGEHAVYFAAAFPGLDWQPTDLDPGNLDSIRAWRAAEGSANLLPPLMLDATAPSWPVTAVSAVLCVNMIHIAPWAATPGLMRGAAAILPPDGPLVLYGPFRRGGAHTAPSNAAFDADLRARDPAWGVRDLESVVQVAAGHGLTLAEVVEMPANNLTVLFRRV